MNTELSKKCAAVRKALPDFSVGIGSSIKRGRIQWHLDECAGCSAELEALQHVAELLSATAPGPAPDRWEAIKPKLTPRTVRVRKSRRRLPFTLAAAAALGAAAVILVNPGQDEAPISDQAYFENHVSMSWRQPFADLPELGMTAAMPAQTAQEDAK